MDARCIPYHAKRKHACTQVAKLSVYHAAASAASEATLIRRVLLFAGLEVRTELSQDSAAARGMCRREGVGTIRHLSTNVYILAEPRRLGDKAIACPQTATSEAVERPGVGPT